MQKYFNYFLDERGEPIRSGSVHVKTSAGATATIYDSNGATTSNPFSTNATGYFEFYAPNSRYTIVLSKSGQTTVTIENVLLDDPTVATIAALKAAGVPTTANARITVLGYTSAGDGGGGDFYWVTGDQSANVTADTQSGIWVAPTSASTGASGAWKRSYSGAIVDKWFGVAIDGATDEVAAFQSAMTALASGGKFKISSGTHYFDVAADADTILIPSNVEIECEPGVVFKWGYWGAPLFAIINKSNVKLKLNGAKFLWTGTFGTTVGSSDKFSYGRSIPAYEWCSHIVSAGSEFVEINDGRCAGNTTSNVQNNFILFRGTSAGGLTEGNKVRNLHIDDVCQGVIFGEQKRFLIDGIDSDRYSNASGALYGAGHVLYVIAGTTASEAGEIRNIHDRAGTALSSFTSGAHTLSLKSLKNTPVSDIYSRRAEGAVNVNDLEDVSIDFRYHSAATDDDTTTGVVYFSATTNPNKYVKIKGEIIQDAQRNFPMVNLAGLTAGSSNLYCELDLSIVRTGDGTESASAVEWVGNYGSAKVTFQNKGSGAQKTIVTVNKTSEDNNFYIRSMGAVANPRIALGATGTQSRNTFWCSGDSTVDYDANEFTPATSNAVIWESARQYQSSSSLGTTTNPTDTFQLPMPGAYLVHLNVISSDANHALAGLYWVVWDNAATNDFTTAQLIGTQITKGASAPTVLGLAVDSAGLCTMTSTAGSNTWLIKYGYKQFSAD